MAIISTTQTVIARYAAGLFGAKLGYFTNNAVIQDVQWSSANGNNGLNTVLNKYYEDSFGKQTSAQVAAIVVANAGIVAGQYGLTAANVSDAVTVVTAALNSAAPTKTQGAAIAKVLSDWSGLEDAAVYGTAAKAWNLKIEQANAYSQNTTSTDAVFGQVNTEFRLSGNADRIVGTADADTIIGNLGTLNDADRIDGAGGVDTLKAIVSGVVAPTIANVENLQFETQFRSNDSGDNNLYSENVVKVDFNTNVTKVSGFNRIEDNNSRADLIIEDVRIGDTQKTKDITIAMVNTDPGNVDYGVYFDQQSLRNTGSGNSSVSIRLMDTGAASGQTTAGDVSKPLLNNPYDTFKFLVNGKEFAINLNTAASKTIASSADSYDQLLAAFKAALASTPEITASFGADFTITDPLSNRAVTGKTIVLQASGNFTIATDATSGWYNTLQAPVPADANIYNKFETASLTTTELVTSTIVLDNVGRGSTSGDLVVGGLSVGETSTSRGVERFEITVLNSSKLQTINGTNNALREVTIKNDKVATEATDTWKANAYTTPSSGDLTVNGNVNGAGTAVAVRGTLDDTILPGVNNGNNPLNRYTADHHGNYGFTDVRLIDASAMTGKLELTAQVTTDSIRKYVNSVDTQANPAADVAGAGNVNFNVQGANFIYTGGSNDDRLVVDIDPAVAASRSNVVSGLSDFTFNIDGGAGNDRITVSVLNSANIGNAQNWYNNQDINNNITINGGAGNDIINKPGAGDVVINAGDGNDVVYTDNTGRQAIVPTPAPAAAMGHYVFNTVDQATALGAVPVAGAYGATARNINDLRSDVTDTYNFYNAKLRVTFKGLQSSEITVAGTDYRTNDLQLNQAIKQAINSDATLKNLLVAEDGPAGTLVVRSLIDGVRTTGELAVSLTQSVTAADISALTPDAFAAIKTAYGLAAAATATDVVTAIGTAHTLFGTNGDYATALSNDGAVNVTGAASVTSSDNLITLGSGDDLVVLGTTVGANTQASSNETLVFGKAFGNDVVVNFAATGAGQDYIDFSALGGNTYSAALNVDKGINIAAQVTTAGAAGKNNTAADVAKLYADGVTAQTYVYLSVDSNNIAQVYSVVDAAGATAGASNVTATLEGTIDLADTSWLTAVAGSTSFARSTAAGYNLLNGPNLYNGTAPAPVVPPAGGATAAAVTVNAAGTVTETAATNTTYTVAPLAGSYTYSIAGFGAGDKIVSPAGATVGIADQTSFTDGSLSVQYTTPGNVVKITLTGLTAAQDGAIFGTADLNTVFGAGTFA